MPISPAVMRFLLLLCLLGMAWLGIFYLRRREMSLGEYLAWGMLAVLLPLVGPFLVILSRPGRLRRAYCSPTCCRRRAGRPLLAHGLKRLATAILDWVDED